LRITPAADKTSKKATASAATFLILLELTTLISPEFS